MSGIAAWSETESPNHMEISHLLDAPTLNVFGSGSQRITTDNESVTWHAACYPPFCLG